jgi:hypothetical protein
MPTTKEADSSKYGAIGIGMKNDLWTRDTLTSDWQQVPNSGSVLGITIMPDGKLLGIGMGNDLWTRDTLTSDWQQVPNSGSVLGITIMPDGKLLGIGMGNDLWTRDTLTSDWQQVPNSGSVLGVTVMPDGKLLGIGMGNDLWTRDTLTSDWKQVPNSGSVLAVTPFCNSLHELRLDDRGYTWCMVESENSGDYCNLTVSEVTGSGEAEDPVGKNYLSFRFLRLEDKTNDAFVVIDPDGNVYNSPANGGLQHGYQTWAAEASSANGLQSFMIKNPKVGVWSAKIAFRETQDWVLFGTTSPVQDHQALATSAFDRLNGPQRLRIANALAHDATTRYGDICIACQAQIVAIMALAAATFVFWIGPVTATSAVVLYAERLLGVDAARFAGYLNNLYGYYKGWQSLKDIPFTICEWEGLCSDQD